MALVAPFTQAWLAKVLGVDPSCISYWCAGRWRPEAHHRAALEILLGIPQDGWLTPAERALVDLCRIVGPMVTAANQATTPEAQVAARRAVMELADCLRAAA